MELNITTQMEPGVLPEIVWNNEDLKKEVACKAADYKNIAYTDDQASDMKKDKAALNKLVTAFEDQRKQVKKFYMAPYEKFERQVKEVLEPVRDAIGIIDAGLAEIDRQYRVDKTNKMHDFYDQYAGNLKGIAPFGKTVKEDLYRKAITDKKLEQYYIDFFKRVQEELETLEELPERFRDKAVTKYADTLSLTEAMREGKRLEELEKVLEERRKQEEAAKAAALEAERKKAAEVQQTAAAAQESTQAISTEPLREPEPCTEKSEKEALLSLDFRVWGTREQLMGLRKYMMDNGIRFGKVE